MASLIDRLDKQIAALTSERARITEQYQTNVAEVDEKLATLASAKKVVSREVEAAYGALLAMGLIKEI